MREKSYTWWREAVRNRMSHIMRRAVRYAMTVHHLTYNLSPILLVHYHVNQRLNRNVVHTTDFDANTVATIPLVFIAALFECRGCANLYGLALVNNSFISYVD